MLHIRLSRTGKRKQPLYRLIVTEKSQDPWGTFLENLGTYNPRSNPTTINFKADRIKDWIAKGAQCSDTVWNLLVEQGMVKGDKVKKVRLSKTRHEKMDKAKADAKAKDDAKKEDPTFAGQEPTKAAEAPAPEPAPTEDASKPGASPKEEPKAEEPPAAEPPKEEPKTEAPASTEQEPAA